jgi:hypothetical protein
MRTKDASLLSLRPSLLHTVKPVRRMAPSAFLSGIVAFNGSIGPHGHAK